MSACVDGTRAICSTRAGWCVTASTGACATSSGCTWLGGSAILDRVDAGRRADAARPTWRRRLGASGCAGSVWRRAWRGARRLERRSGLMARKTSFYYSFLVLPPEQRRAIIAVWDFCRAVDDAVDEPEIAAARRNDRRSVCAEIEAARARARALACGAGARVTSRATPQTPQGRSLQPFIAPFDLPRQAFEDVIDGVAMDLDTTRYQTFDDLLRVLLPRRVGGRAHLHQDLRLHTSRARRQYALNLGVALQLTNILRDVKDDLDRGRVYLPLEDLAAAGCRSRISRPAASPSRCGGCSRSSAGAPTSSTQRAARSRPPEGSPPAGRGRDHARGLLRNAAPDRAERLRRLLGPVRVRRSRSQALIALRQWAWPPMTAYDVVVIGAGFAGLSAAVRLTQRGRARPRARGAQPPRRPGDGVPGPRDGRACRQRSARARSAATRRRSRFWRDIGACDHVRRAATAGGDDGGSRRGTIDARVSRRCRRRCISWPACSTGTRSRWHGPAVGAADGDADAPGAAGAEARRRRRSRPRRARRSRAGSCATGRRHDSARCSGNRWRWRR